jgi:hypothetical protein
MPEISKDDIGHKCIEFLMPCQNMSGKSWILRRNGYRMLNELPLNKARPFG